MTRVASPPPSRVIKSARTTDAWLHAMPCEAKIRKGATYRIYWLLLGICKCLFSGCASTKHSEKKQTCGKLLNSSLLQLCAAALPRCIRLAADAEDEL